MFSLVGDFRIRGGSHKRNSQSSQILIPNQAQWTPGAPPPLHERRTKRRRLRSVSFSEAPTVGKCSSSGASWAARPPGGEQREGCAPTGAGRGGDAEGRQYITLLNKRSKWANSGQAWSSSGQVWLTMGHRWSNLVEFGPMLADIGPLLVDPARCVARFGRVRANRLVKVERNVADPWAKFVEFGRSRPQTGLRSQIWSIPGQLGRFGSKHLPRVCTTPVPER